MRSMICAAKQICLGDHIKEEAMGRPYGRCGGVHARANFVYLYVFFLNSMHAGYSFICDCTMLHQTETPRL